MTFSAPRLTIYALLSAVEEDLRGFMIEYLTDTEPPRTLLGEELHARALERYSDENGPADAEHSLRDLLPFVDFGDLVEIVNRSRAKLPQHIANHVRALNPQLQLLLPIRKRIAHIRPFRYDDLARVTSFTDQVSSSHPSHWPSVTETVARLSRDPAFVFDLPLPRYEEPVDSAYHNLPLPEFDDTGFLGREAEVSSVLSLCKGAWPVISVVGEGGLGKTALALRCAYDLVDAESQFDAIVWSSSKTTRLDPTQIREIDGSIRDSLGLFEFVAKELGAPASDSETVEEILQFLETFRVLLILDNLETVLDDNIRAFLGRLPQGSKILITSRIGIGEYEYRVNLQPLPNVDAARLLRAVAKVSGVKVLATMPEQDLGEMCDRMQNNPLFIKWFVSAVQAGVPIEEVLVDPSLFLDFCMSNVYDHLSEASTNLLKVLLASPDELSLPELIFFNGDDTYQTQGAVQELLTTNLLAMNSHAYQHGQSVETRYRLTDLARLYLTRHHPLSQNDDQAFERARLRLAHDQRRISHQISGDPYEARTIVTRSKSDLLAARPLLDAIRHANAGKFAEALDAVLAAKGLAPDYYECFRVEGQVHAAARNVAVADAAFRTALGLMDDSAPLCYFYAQFLRGVRHDIDAALGQLARGLEIDAGAPQVLIENARCNLEALAFAEARSSIDDLLMNRQLSPAVERDAWRLNCDFWIASANFAAETKGYFDAMAALESLRRDVGSAPPSVSTALQSSLPRAIGAAWCCVTECPEEGIKQRAQEFLRWLRSQRGFRSPYAVPLSDSMSFGWVKYVDRTREFGFINSEAHGEVYFNRGAMRIASDFDLLRGGPYGTHVEYRLAASEKGRKGLEVAIA